MARMNGLGLAMGVLSAFAGECHGQPLRAGEQAGTALAVHLAQANNKGP